MSTKNVANTPMPDEPGTLRLSIKTAKDWSWKEFFLQWEWMLVGVLFLVILISSNLSPFFLYVDTFVRAPITFLDKAFMVFPMIFIIILGKIDISVGSNVALSAVLMAVAYNAGLPMPLAMVLCLGVATLGGFINGLLIIKFKELSFVIVTLSTMIIYRGIANIILGDKAAGGFPEWFGFFGWGYVFGVPFMFIAFIMTAILFGLILHKTSFGRSIYGMGFNMTTCKYSGIDTDKIQLIVFTLAGLMAGVTAIFLTSRMGSTRPNVATGYELEVITMVALGGVSTSGGIGKIFGPVLAVFIVGFLGYGLGLANIQAPVVLVIIGLLLILSILVMKIRIRTKKKTAVLVRV